MMAESVEPLSAPMSLVLVVDDEADIREPVAMLLEDAGYRVVTAADGLEALDQVSRELPAVILLDMRMPRMDGWQFARECRARFNRQVPIVVMTAAQDARQRAADVGAEAFVAKPFDLDHLLAVVQEQARR
jgi:CheY-like chemotaxis protein